MSESNLEDNTKVVELTSRLVSAYVSNNPIAAGDLPSLINEIHTALGQLSSQPKEEPVEKQKPAVSIKKSLGRDYLICLEDGKKYKSLKRHLERYYNLSPDQYREKWGLPSDYPMVAPSYAEHRSRLAKEMGLGQKKQAA